MISKKVVMAATALATLSMTSANAFERGFPGWQNKPGGTLGSISAATPGPGIYGTLTGVTYQANTVGPTANLIGSNTVSTNTAAGAILWVPGWTFLGATYSAAIAQPLQTAAIVNPAGTALFSSSGLHNTVLVPAELSWKLGDSGFFVKTNLTMFAPDGTITGPSGLNSFGSPWWTYQPGLTVSYLKDGWNFTVNTSMEINTKNSITGYTSGNLLHAEFTATKTFGAWTVGPVAYYVGQVTDDTSSAFYANAINLNRYNSWAAGGKVGYNFGPATLNVWGLKEIRTDGVCGATCATGSVASGWTGFASLSFRIWAPDAPVATPKLFHK